MIAIITVSVISAPAAAQTQSQPHDDTRAIGVRAKKGKSTEAPIIEPLPPDGRRAGSAALFVGVNNFSIDQGLRALRFAVNDAVAQAHLFVHELKLIPPENTYLALAGDPSNEEARQQLQTLLNSGVHRVDAGRSQILQRAMTVVTLPDGPEDLLIVSIASHGFEDAGIAYAMPADGLRATLKDTGINLLQLEQWLSESKAGKRLLLLDVCREYAFTGTRGGGSPMTDAFKAALAAARGQAVLASCDAGQFSYEDADAQHGVFSHALLAALRGGATPDPRGFITLGAASDYVARAVAEWVARQRPNVDPQYKQQPWFKGPKAAEQIPLAINVRARDQHQTLVRDADEVKEILKAKVEQKGPFDAEVYQSLAELIVEAVNDEHGSDLVEQSQAFAAGDVSAADFVKYLRGLMDERRRMIAEASVAQRLLKIELLLDAAREHDQPEDLNQSRIALTKLNELLAIDPAHAEALSLKEKIEGYFGPRHGDVYENSIGMKLVYLAPGRFIMGSASDEPQRDGDETRRSVTLTRAFYIGATEVTQAQWKRVMGLSPAASNGENKPVERVSWDDAVAFCRALSQIESVNGRRFRYRLPTEAEWEYAARAGTSGPFHTGFSISTDQANYNGAFAYIGGVKGEIRRTPIDVASFEPNAWGLYDMHGNVWEWCADWYDAYPPGPAVNPAGPPRGEQRIVRGGSFALKPADARSANRDKERPNARLNTIGFRVVLEPGDFSP